MNITSAAEAANMAETIKAKFAEMSAAARNVSTGGGGSSGGSYTSGACPFGSNTVQTGANLPVAGSWNGSIETQTNVQMGYPNYGFRSKAYQQAYNVLPCAASGGEVTDEGVVLVGEQVPELIKLPRGAKVSSTHHTRERIGGDQKASGHKNEVHLHIGTFVGDQAGLRKLQRLLEGMRISENVRKGVTV